MFLVLLIIDIVCWIIFACSESGIAGMLGMIFLILCLAIIAGSIGAETPFKRIDNQQKEINAARVNEYRLRNLFDSICKKK